MMFLLLPGRSCQLIYPHRERFSTRTDVKLYLPNSSRSPSGRKITRRIFSQLRLRVYLAINLQRVEPKRFGWVCVNITLERMPAAVSERTRHTRDLRRNPSRIFLVPDVVFADAEVTLSTEHVV